MFTNTQCILNVYKLEKRYQDYAAQVATQKIQHKPFRWLLLTNREKKVILFLAKETSMFYLLATAAAHAKKSSTEVRSFVNILNRILRTFMPMNRA